MTDAPDRSPQLPGAAPDQSPMLSGLCPPHELRLLQAIRESELAPEAEGLMRQAKTSVRILPRREEVSVGLSRFGGRPDLPADWSWPTWDNSRWILSEGPRGPNAPLDFIAQIRLDALPAHPDGLPHAGILYFFHARNGPWGFEPAHGPGSRVLYYDGPTDALAPVEMPAKGATRPFHECALDFELLATLPSQPIADDDTWWSLCHRIHPQSFHHLGGHPQPVQNEMTLECQLVTNGLNCGDATGWNDPRADALEPGAADWQLLLQVDTDDDVPGWVWGDGGMLYWWIRRQDLAARRFDRAWVILQCG